VPKKGDESRATSGASKIAMAIMGWNKVDRISISQIEITNDLAWHFTKAYLAFDLLRHLTFEDSSQHDSAQTRSGILELEYEWQTQRAARFVMWSCEVAALIPRRASSVLLRHRSEKSPYSLAEDSAEEGRLP